MNIVFGISISVEFWRRIYSAHRTPQPAPFAKPCDCAVTRKDVMALVPKWVSPHFLEPTGGKISVLAFDRQLRRESADHIVRIWSGRVPEGSFYALNDNVYIMSPGFMFLYAARMLSFHKLVAFGDELCGLYSFDARETRGFRKRSAPLIAKEQLARYIASAKGCYGYSQALAALRHVVDRSASPMETFDEMAMCLPYRLGGYCMPLFAMNHPVPLGKKAARIARRKTCYADMCYPDVPLDVEHHGRFDHTSPDDVERDRARVNGLKEEGFDVIELTARQVGDLFAFEYIILHIASIIGKRVKPEALGATPQRIFFRDEVLSWNRSGGRIEER